MQTSRSKRNAPNWLIAVLVIAALIVLVAACGAAPTPTPTPQPTSTPAPPTPTLTANQLTAAVSFSKHILPVFQKNCTTCHGGANPAAGLNLETREGAIKGSSSGAVVALAFNASGLTNVGSPGHSLLYQYVSKGAMPKDDAQLSQADLSWLSAWMFIGAPNN